LGEGRTTCKASVLKKSTCTGKGKGRAVGFLRIGRASLVMLRGEKMDGRKSVGRGLKKLGREWRSTRPVPKGYAFKDWDVSGDWGNLRTGQKKKKKRALAHAHMAGGGGGGSSRTGFAHGEKLSKGLGEMG